MANIANALKEVEDTWESSDAIESQGFSPLPDGNYSGKAMDGVVEMSQNGRLQITLTLKPTEGKYEDKTIKKFMGLDNELSIGYAKGTLKLLGIENPKSITKLPKVLTEFFSEHDNGVDIEFTVKTKDDFVNIYINKLIDADTEKDKSSTKKDKNKKEKIKKPTYSELEDMDKDDLIKVIEKFDLGIEDTEKIKEAKLLRIVAEELGVEQD